MEFLVTLFCVTMFSLIFKKALLKLPVVFYIVALALVVGYLNLFFFSNPIPVIRGLLLYFQRCLIALSFFTIVMFVGVFSAGSPVRKYFMPIRRQLSILGAIFSCGHIIVYSVILLPRLFSAASFTRLDVTTSLLIALATTLLLIPLTLTSFNVIKRHMKPDSWKRIQLLAYPFFALVYVHLMSILLPNATADNPATVFKLALYTVIFGSYLVLRVRMQIKDGAAEKALVQKPADQAIQPNRSNASYESRW